MTGSVLVNCVSGLFKYQSSKVTHCLNTHHQGTMTQGGLSMSEEAIQEQRTVICSEWS